MPSVWTRGTSLRSGDEIWPRAPLATPRPFRVNRGAIGRRAFTQGERCCRLGLRPEAAPDRTRLFECLYKGVTVMGYRIFLAKASGAVGRRLTSLLRCAGHYVCGSTRSQANADALRSLGADPVVVDVFDTTALSRAVKSARPDIVIHQFTYLPKDLNPRKMGAAGSHRPPPYAIPA